MSLTEENAIFQAIGELKGKVDSFLITQSTQQGRLDAIEKRLGSMETKGAWLVGAASIVGFIISGLVNVLIQLYRGMH